MGNLPCYVKLSINVRIVCLMAPLCNGSGPIQSFSVPSRAAHSESSSLHNVRKNKTSKVWQNFETNKEDPKKSNANCVNGSLPSDTTRACENDPLGRYSVVHLSYSAKSHGAALVLYYTPKQTMNMYFRYVYFIS